MAANDLKRIYIDGGQTAPPPPGFVLDATIPPVPPPPPDGYVPDTAAPYKAPVDATPNPDDVMEDDTASPYRDAQVPAPPAGFVPDVSAEQHPQGRGILQALKDYPLHVVQGLWDTVKKPGQLIAPNPYPEGSEEAQFFEESRQKGIEQAAPELGMMTLGGGAAGAPAAAGDVVLGSGPVRIIKNIMSPDTVSPVAKGAAADIRAAGGQAARDTATTAAAFDQQQRVVSKLKDPQKLGLLDYIENRSKPNAPPVPPGLMPLADTVKAAMEKRLQKLRALPSVDKMDFVEDYYPHMWQDPAKAASFVQEYTGGAARQGSGASLKKRTMPTIADGIAAGLKPISLDPIETSMRYVQSMDRFIATQQVLDKAVADGNIKYIKPRVMGASGNPEGYQVPPGWQPINGRGSTNAGGARAYAPEDFARVYNNFIDQGVYRNADWGKVYDAARNASNAVTSLELGLSGFHAATMAQEAVVNSVAKGIGELAAGRPLDAIKSIGSAPAKPITNLLKGREIEKVYLDKQQGSPLTRQITDLLTEAGGRGKGTQHAPDYRYSQAGSYWDSFKRGTIRAEIKAAGQTIKASPITGPIKVTMQQVGRVMSTVAKPLFEYAIPKLKNGAFYDNMASWLQSNPNATHEMQVKAARAIWDSIDNRFGEMVSDNIFWNKTMKQALQVSLRSYSWTTGTLRELGGGAAKLARHPSSLSPRSPHYSPKAAYVIALPFTYATLNAVYQYLKTGTAPESISDVMRGGLTGGTAPGVGGRGTVPERAMMPGYMKDVFGWYFDPTQEAANKVATLPRMAKEAITNKDWKGQPIRNPEDPTADQVREFLQYVYQSLGPISLKQTLKGQKTGSNISTPETLLGVHPAPTPLQDPIGLQNALSAIHRREWEKKKNLDARQEKQYGGPSPGVPVVKPVEAPAVPDAPKPKRSHHRKD